MKISASEKGFYSREFVSFFPVIWLISMNFERD